MKKAIVMMMALVCAAMMSSCSRCSQPDEDPTVAPPKIRQQENTNPALIDGVDTLKIPTNAGQKKMY